MDKEVNFDVLNTLYLIKESLGDSYLNENFNPFSDDFSLNKNSVQHFLEVKAQKKLLKPPEFVDKSEKEILTALKLGKQNTSELLQALETELDNEFSMYLEHQISYLKIRKKMLEDLLQYELNYEELVEVLQILEALDKNYAKILKKSFEKGFDVQIAIQQFMEICRQKQDEKFMLKLNERNKSMSASAILQTKNTTFQTMNVKSKEDGRNM